ncbi:response regulator transcription factor [Pacificimonas sp. WHA3]|uniref:Response regulator transcription factor n=1 Tax=Pacificimonas pallii TaxID=2827236 RepID=A0ABS6SFI1_9SPHN|nr:LytTR family DNA-binding domain-containing protein [Pacificimonas pallii]MBV7257168.1 response regulator transcription factor [Pacificimonas pallii]
MNADSGRLRAVIVDDEAMAVERMELLLSRMDFVDCIGTAEDGEAALALLAETKPDFVILDINMPGLTGVDVAEALTAEDDPPAIIFATAYDEHAIRAFELAAVDYLLKPVSIPRLQQAVERVRARQPAKPASSMSTDGKRYITEFWVRHRADMVRIDVDQIDHIEAERDYMRLHTAHGSHLIHETAKRLERRLNPEHFIRTHRSHIFRRAAIERLENEGFGTWSVRVSGREPVRVGRTYLAGLKAAMKA